MGHATSIGTAETTRDEKFDIALDGLDLIERATRDGCSARVLQDIVGNLLVILAWLEDAAGALQHKPLAAERRVRVLLTDCLVKAGVPPHAVADSLSLVRDCVGHDGMACELDLDSPVIDARLAD